MVTVLMAILIFMGIGWQFAFEQWGLSNHSESIASTVTLPISITTFLQGATSDTGSGAFSFGIAPNNASSIVVYSQGTGPVNSRWILLAK